jgi:SIR2-like domain
MPLDYKQYKDEVMADIAKVLADASCQPILFVGSGFTKRYAAGPSWEELLTSLAKGCPAIDKEFAYYKQMYNGDLKKIGSVFADLYREWAWAAKSKSKFPAEYFTADAPSDIFFKHTIAELLKDLGPNSKGSYGSPELDAEIEALKNISAHAVVTTNYDEVIERLFPDYKRIIGQKVMREPYLSIGEIFKIHGCRSEPNSIIISEADYKKFEQDHKYLSAKLLTYFVEHPLIFIGYRAEDPNIKAILYDVDRMVKADFQLVPNIYILQWDSSLTADSYPARDRVLSVAADVNVRIKSISASSFEWVFKAFGQAGNLEKINTKLLRALMARSVELVRSNIPKKHVNINFEQLAHAVESGENFAKLFGVTSLADPSKVNLDYRYVLSEVAKILGYKGWNDAQKLVDVLRDQTGFDMKASDNKYHVEFKFGPKSQGRHKYTEAAVDLLRRIQNGQDYTLEKDPVDASAVMGVV